MVSLENFNGVVIIGSGPTAVSSAWPLVHAGINVLMLEAGNQIQNNWTSDRPDLKDLRVNCDDSKYTYRSGIENSAFGENEFVSPKLRVTAPLNLLYDFRKNIQSLSDGFNPIGAMCEGGLSNFWGGSCAEWDRNELTSLIDFDQMAISYKNISSRIGLCGSLDDSMSKYLGINSEVEASLDLSPLAEKLLNKYNTKKIKNFYLGRPRLAVLTKNIKNRQPCVYCKSCMYGCHNKSIYNASFDIEELKKFKNFQLRHNAFVSSVIKSGNNFIVQLGNDKKIKTSYLVLAAGVISTTRLFLEYKKIYNKKIRILTNPAFSFSLFTPSMLGKPLSGKGFSLAQLAFTSSLAKRNLKIFGMIYDADSFPVSDLISHSPLSVNSSKRFFRATLSSLSLGMGYLPGSLSDSYIILSQDNKLYINSNLIPKAALYQNEIKNNLFNYFWALDSILLPGTFSFFDPGSEVHYAGTLPIGSEYLDIDCSIKGEKNFYIADASSLPLLSEKPHTLTAMANADRVGRAIVKKIQLSD